MEAFSQLRVLFPDTSRFVQTVKKKKNYPGQTPTRAALTTRSDEAWLKTGVQNVIWEQRKNTELRGPEGFKITTSGLKPLEHHVVATSEESSCPLMAACDLSRLHSNPVSVPHVASLEGHRKRKEQCLVPLLGEGGA